MTTPVSLRKLIAVVAFALVQPAAAAQGETIALQYRGYWGGFHAGDMTLTVTDSPGRKYQAEFKIASAGVIRWASNFVMTATSAGDFGSATLLPDFYSLESRSPKREREIRVEFDQRTQVATKTVDRIVPQQEDDLADDKPLPEDLRRNVLDPLTALVAMRSQVDGALKGGAKFFTLPAFDGKRRFDIRAEVLGPGTHDFDRRRVETVDVILTVKPRAGFKRRHQDIWNDAQIKVYLDPEHLLPLRMVSDDFAVASVVTAVRECRENEVASCMIPVSH